MYRTSLVHDLDLDMLLEQFSDPRNGSIEDIAGFYGVSYNAMSRRLRTDIAKFTQAQEVKAYRLHEYSISQIYAEPARITDAAGCGRIDPGAVTLQKYRSDTAARVAGILDYRLSERKQLEITVTANPLADAIQRIAQAGSSIPIQTIEGEYETVNEPAPKQAHHNATSLRP